MLCKRVRLLLQIALNVIVFVCKVVLGRLSNSLSMKTDALHSLSHIFPLLICLLSIHLSHAPATSNTYGWARVELLGALCNAVFLLALYFFLFIKSIQRICLLEQVSQPGLLIAAGVLSVCVDVVGILLFRTYVSTGDERSGKSPCPTLLAQDDDNSQALLSTQGGESENSVVKRRKFSEYFVESRHDFLKLSLKGADFLNMQAIYLHILADFFSSIIIILNAVVILTVHSRLKFYVDPFLSIVLVVCMISITIPLATEVALILVQCHPLNVDPHVVCNLITSSIPNVKKVHELHIWQLVGNVIIATMKFSCHDYNKYISTAKALKDLFHTFNIHSTTFEPVLDE